MALASTGRRQEEVQGSTPRCHGRLDSTSLSNTRQSMATAKCRGARDRLEGGFANKGRFTRRASYHSTALIVSMALASTGRSQEEVQGRKKLFQVHGPRRDRWGCQRSSVLNAMGPRVNVFTRNLCCHCSKFRQANLISTLGRRATMKLTRLEH